MDCVHARFQVRGCVYSEVYHDARELSARCGRTLPTHSFTSVRNRRYRLTRLSERTARGPLHEPSDIWMAFGARQAKCWHCIVPVDRRTVADCKLQAGSWIWTFLGAAVHAHSAEELLPPLLLQSPQTSWVHPRPGSPGSQARIEPRAFSASLGYSVRYRPKWIIFGRPLCCRLRSSSLVIMSLGDGMPTTIPRRTLKTQCHARYMPESSVCCDRLKLFAVRFHKKHTTKPPSKIKRRSILLKC